MEDALPVVSCSVAHAFHALGGTGCCCCTQICAGASTRADLCAAAAAGTPEGVKRVCNRTTHHRESILQRGLRRNSITQLIVGGRWQRAGEPRTRRAAGELNMQSITMGTPESVGEEHQRKNAVQLLLTQTLDEQTLKPITAGKTRGAGLFVLPV